MPVFRINRLRWNIQQAGGGDPPPDPGVADYYVAPAGVASGSGVGSYLDPFTWQQAFALNVTGAIFEYRPGLYDGFADSSTPYPGSYLTAGAAGQVNIHRAQYPVVHNLGNEAAWSKWHKSSGSGGIVGMPSYTEIDGFDIQQNGTWSNAVSGEQYAVHSRDNGGGVFTDVTVRRCRFDAVLSDASGSNWGFIFCQDVVGLEVCDCVFTNLTAAGNITPIELYDTDTYEVHHNYFENCGNAFFPKGVISPPERNLIPGSFHHNRLVNVTQPLYAGGIGEGDAAGVDLFLYYQNLCTGWRQLQLTNYGNTSQPRNMLIVNNTFAANGNLVADGMFYLSLANYAGTTVLANSLFQNNIVSMDYPITVFNDAAGDGAVGTLASRMPFSRNTYHGVTQFYKGGSFANWTASMTVGEVQRDPLFVGGGDYTLSGGSSEIGAGVDVLDLLGGGTSGPINRGCYILPDQSDVIGIRPAA